MLRTVMIALVATTFMGAMAASTTADAQKGRGGGGFRGGGMHVGGGGMRSFSGGGFRTGIAGPRFRTAAFAGRPFIGPRHFAFRHGFAHRRFAFAAVPFAVGVYGGSCWRWRPGPWGWQRVWVCGYRYGYGY